MESEVMNEGEIATMKAEAKLLNTIANLLYFVPIFLFLEVFLRVADVSGSVGGGLNALTVGAIWYLIISKIVKVVNDQMNAQREFEMQKFEDKQNKKSSRKKKASDEDE